MQKKANSDMIILRNNQVKTKKRIADHGEVFTHERQVNAMLDLVNNETERMDSRFLEPACGSGNFLVEILNRKLNIVTKKYKRSLHDYEKYSLIAVGSIYGIDLLEDNVKDCRIRLLETFVKEYKSIFKSKINKKFIEIIEFVLKKNIICGDALSLKNENGLHLTFSEWTLPYNDALIKRKDYIFENILNPESFGGNFAMNDTGSMVAFPNILKDYPPISYMRLNEYE